MTRKVEPDTRVNLYALYPKCTPIKLEMSLEQAHKHVALSVSDRDTHRSTNHIMYRCFEALPQNRERFMTAWVVKDGKVEDHPAVTIPKEFF